MNRFAIEEDDQFEIHVKNYEEKRYISKKETDALINNVAEEVMFKAQQGSGNYRLLIVTYDTL